MRHLILFILFSLGLVCQADQWARYDQLDVRHYDVALFWDGMSAGIEADVTVVFSVRETPFDRFHLDFHHSMTLRTATLIDMEADISHEGDRLWVKPQRPLTVDQDYRLRVVYAGQPGDGLIIGQNKFGEPTMFSDHWPNRAHHWLPSVDHPGDKATARFQLTAPAAFQAVAVGRLISEVDLPNGLRRTVWKMSRPIPTKVMVAGIAKFAVIHHRPYKNLPLQSWVFPQQAELATRAFEAVSRESLAFFEAEIGPYPYGKLANVISRTRYGGMENAGTIFYSENALDRDVRDRDALIAHEIAHQWFGNHVSEASWEHVWLSEGFATYWSAKLIGHRYDPTVERQVWTEHRQRVLAFAANRPERAIVMPVDQPSNAILSALTYQKGAWFLRMLRERVGHESFSLAIRSFFREFSGGNARTEDFRQAIEKASGEDLQAFFDIWLRTGAIPEVVLTASIDDGHLSVTARQQQAATFEPLQLDFTVQWKDGTRQVQRFERVGKASASTVRLPLKDGGFSSILPDPDVRLLATFHKKIDPGM